MGKRKEITRRKHSLVNSQYVVSLFKDYLLIDDEAKIFLLAERVVNQYEREIFTKIREMCCEEAMRLAK